MLLLLVSLAFAQETEFYLETPTVAARGELSALMDVAEEAGWSARVVRRYELGDGQVTTFRADGTATIYRAGERIELDETGKQRGRQAFRCIRSLTVERGADGRLRAEVTAETEIRQETLRRTYTRFALPRREVRDE